MGWTLTEQARRAAKGYGAGEGDAYVPWLGIRDVPSTGLRTRMRGRVSDRMHSLMSMLERQTLLIVQRMPGVVDIREQYPLPLEGTDEVARRLGYKPPRHHGHPVTMTTDLLVHFSGPDGTWREAISVKPSAKACLRRVGELFAIEKGWWADQGTRCRMVTELQLPPAIVSNLEWIDEHWQILPGTLGKARLEDIEVDLLGRLRDGEAPIWAAAAATDARLALEPGTAVLVFRHLLARGRWRVPLDIPIDTGVVLDPATLAVGDWS